MFFVVTGMYLAAFAAAGVIHAFSAGRVLGRRERFAIADAGKGILMVSDRENATTNPLVTIDTGGMTVTDHRDGATWPLNERFCGGHAVYLSSGEYEQVLVHPHGLVEVMGNVVFENNGGGVHFWYCVKLPPFVKSP